MVNRFFKSIPFLIYLVVVLIAFRNWFSLNPLSSGDWEYYFSETIRDFPLFPQVWNIWYGNGFGVNLSFFMNLNSFFMSSTTFFHDLGLPWIIIERLFWFWPYLILVTIAPFLLVREVFPKMSINFLLIASAVYTFNTYSLMLVGGGQMGVALAYAMSPLVLLFFIKLCKNFFLGKKIFLSSVFFGLILSLQVLLDIRITYVSLVAVFGYLIWIMIFSGKGHLNLSKILNLVLFIFLIPIFIVLANHLWWILPFVFSAKNPLSSLGDIYISSESIRFFSFSSFSHALSLLQPNWPENIFGKTSFLKFEFLILPLFAFLSLLFLKKLERVLVLKIVFFILLSILAVFLAKGANAPFGLVYVFLFDNLPGFYMFRDPTKWYTLIALSYSVLITFSIYQTHIYFSKKGVLFKISKYILGFLFLSVGLFLISPVFNGELKGTFAAKSIPNEYLEYKDFMLNDPSFGRVLWVPQKNRYAFYNALHPNVSATDFFEETDPEKIVKLLEDPEVLESISSSGIKYIAIPTDPLGEIFLEDRKYSEGLRNFYTDSLGNIFAAEQKIENLHIYNLSESRDLFVTEGNKIDWRMQSMTSYSIAGLEGSRLEYVVSYDPDWVFGDSSKVVSTREYMEKFNSFESISSKGKVYYRSQVWVGRGFVLGFIMLLSVFFSYVYFEKLGKRRV